MCRSSDRTKRSRPRCWRVFVRWLSLIDLPTSTFRIVPVLWGRRGDLDPERLNVEERRRAIASWDIRTAQPAAVSFSQC